MVFYPLAAVPAVSGAVVLATGIYALRRGGFRPDTRAFFLFTFFIFLTAVASFLLRTVPGGEGLVEDATGPAVEAARSQALLWARILYFSHVLGVSFLLGTVVEFLDIRVLRRPGVTLLFQVGSAIAALAAALSVGEVEFYPGVGVSVEGKDTVVLALVVPLFALSAFALLLWGWLRSTGDLRHRLGWALLGLSAPIVLGSTTAVTRIHLGVHLPPIVNYGAVVTAVAFGYGVFRKHLLVLPAAPAAVPTPPKFALQAARIYAVPGPTGERAYEILADAVAHGRPGLLVTTLDPKEVRAQHNLEGTSALRISTVQALDAVGPRHLMTLGLMMRSFVQQARHGVVLVDCLETLYIENGGEAARRFLGRLGELAAAGPTVLVSASKEFFAGEFQDDVKGWAAL